MNEAKTSSSLSTLLVCVLLCASSARCVGHDGFGVFAQADSVFGSDNDGADPAPGDQTDDCGAAC